MDEQKKQTVFDPAKVIAIGIASPAAGFLTSRFGVAGTLIGLALGAMILTAVADFLKVYLARTSHAAAHAAHMAAYAAAATTKVPRRRGLLARLFRRRSRPNNRSLKAPYRGFSSPPARRRRSLFLLVGRSVVAAGISFILALGVVTTLEHNAGKSLTCWVWEECPAESSTEEGGGTSDESTTRPSIFGGGPTAGSDAAVVGVRPTGPQQQPTSPLGTPEPPSSQAPSQAAGSEGSGSGAGDQWQEQSDQQQDSYYYRSEEEYEQQSSSSSTAEEDQWREYRDGSSRDWGHETPQGYEVPSVPWTT